ncbi:MAG TPA: hypothetical protein PLH27_10075 [bacterium]|nr:hypothetical protein [bacterium]HMW34752.1 hypothetical protein [bacterium]HMY37192.1 hypothetical protein [bacterium]HMZ03544.1 hypothetical protein [bacterium]HNB09857.1 hypothetical protein [bacterium]
MTIVEIMLYATAFVLVLMALGGGLLIAGMSRSLGKLKERVRALEHIQEERAAKKGAGTDDTTKIKSFETQIKALKAELESLRSMVVAPTPAEPAASDKEVFYVTASTTDGFIRKKDLKVSPGFDSLFKVELNADKQTGTVTIWTGSENMTQAITFHDRYLQPLCEYTYNPQRSTRNVTVKKPGMIKLESDRYVIVEKMVIEFE